SSSAARADAGSTNESARARSTATGRTAPCVGKRNAATDGVGGRRLGPGPPPWVRATAPIPTPTPAATTPKTAAARSKDANRQGFIATFSPSPPVFALHGVRRRGGARMTRERNARFVRERRCG